MHKNNSFNKSSGDRKKLGKMLLQQLDFFSGEMNAMQLISDGADIYQRDKSSGATTLIKAAATHKTGSMYLILQRDDQNMLHDTDNNGLNALSHAVLSGDRQSVDMLLHNGAHLTLTQSLRILETSTNKKTLALLHVVAQTQDAAAPATATPAARTQKPRS
jgi:ankyrin repeat protein